MSMRFNRFYNKLSKKNNKINLASYDDKLISSVPAEELDLPNGYTISDNKVFYNDTEIGKFSYRNVDEMGSIDLDSINIVDNEPVLDLDGINIPEEDNEPVLDLDGINIPEEDNEPVLDLDGINIVPSKATNVPKTTIDDTELVNEGHVFPSYEIKEEFTTQEQQELLEKIHDVQEDLRKSFLEYESNKKDLSEDYVKQIEGYKTRFNDMQEEITFESKSNTEAQLDELIRMKKQVDNSNNRVNMNINKKRIEEYNSYVYDLRDMLERCEILSEHLTEEEKDLVKMFKASNNTVSNTHINLSFIPLNGMIESKKEDISKIEKILEAAISRRDLSVEQEKTDNLDKEKEKLADEYRTKYYENKGLVAECKKLLKYMDADKKVDFESREADYNNEELEDTFRFDFPTRKDRFGNVALPLSISELEARIRMASSDHYKLKEFVKNAQDNKTKSNEKEITGREILEAAAKAEEAKKAENKEVKAKKALIAKSLVKDMKDIITKEAKVVGMRALAFTLKQVADIKKAAEEKVVEIKTSVPEKKYSTALDKIRAKKEQEAVKQEASDIVKELKEKTEEPKMVVPEFLRITKKEEKVEKVEPEVKPEPVVVEETITTKTDVNFNTLNERIYDKYSISDLKELDSKIEKNNSKLEKTNEKIDKKEKKILEAEVGLELAIKNSDLESELVYRKKIEDLKSKLEELKDKAESLKFKIASRKDVINRFKEQSIVVYEQNLAEENRIMQEKEDVMNARLEKEAIEERDNTRKDISKVFRKAEDGELSALNYKNNNEIKKLLKYTSQLEEEGKDPKEFLKKYAEALEAEKKASDNLKELEMAMGLVKEDKKKTAKRK